MNKLPALLTALVIATPVWAAPADDMRMFLDQGKDREAYALGARHPEELGKPFFDFFFGIAALNAGAPGEGVLAIERYLMHFPENRSARFHLARGYYILGEDQRAREEFEALRPDARDADAQRITEFLDSIKARESRYKPSVMVYAEVGVGRDSNINSGVAAGQIQGLPLGYVVTPGQTSEKLADTVATAAVGVQGTYPVAPGMALYGGASVGGRHHGKAESDVFDQVTLSLQAGVSILKGRHLVRLGTDITRLDLDHQKYLSLNTAVADWQYQWDQFNKLGAALQVTGQRYRNITTYVDLAKTTPVPSGADVRDSRVTSASGFWTHVLPHDWNPTVTLGLNASEERNLRERTDLSRNLAGMRLATTMQPAPNWSVGAALAYQRSRYRADFATGIGPRRDGLYALDLGVSYTISPRWSLRGEYQRSIQHSNIGLYQFSRDIVMFKVRYETR